MTGIEFILDLAIVALFAGVAGFLCRWLKLSVVVGYLLAGMAIGPFTPPFQLIQDAGRVQMLADLGLLFLIFSIGLGFSFSRLNRLGASLILATALGAVLVMFVCRATAAVFGVSDQQGLFVASVLMVSSSAVIAKVLEETRMNHTRWGQLALGITLLEDIVAVIMLTLLASMTTVGGAKDSLWQTLSSFTGFVVLFTIVVLLFMPRLLRWLENSATPELKMLLVTGLLLILGWVAVTLGYSMALTAFIMGAIIGSTPQRPIVDRLFEGIRHLFGAVFFVAMGMLFDISLLAEFWPLLLALIGASLLIRIPAIAAGLVLVGTNLRDALRTGIVVTPLGEFSFVIALLGVNSGVMPEKFYPAAVGASLVTCILSPILIRRADSISAAVEKLTPASVKNGFTFYHQWLARMQHVRERSILWKIVAPRVLQTIVQLLFVSGCLAIAKPAYQLILRIIGPDLLFNRGTIVLFMLALGVMLLPPLVAVWRNISALSMIVSEAMAIGEGRRSRTRRIVQRAFSATAIIIAALWLSILIPTDVISLPILALIILVLALLTALLWRTLILWQSRFEIRLQSALSTASLEPLDQQRHWSIASLENNREWDLVIEEITLSVGSIHAGRTIGDLKLRTLYGCSLVGIDRQGYALNNPPADERLYPGDRLLLLGTEQNLDNALVFLGKRSDAPSWLEHFDELGTESVEVPDKCACDGRTLLELDLVRRFGVQIGGIRRSGEEIVSPSANEIIQGGDVLLVIGVHENIARFIAHMNKPMDN